MAGNDQFSAAEQGLGYFYQPRLALLHLLRSAEETSVFIEKDDDLEFVDVGGRKTLGSLKHKGAGGRLTDLSTDFWKSVRIWLTRYDEAGRLSSTHRFYLFTTEEVSDASFLKSFLSSDRATGEPLSQLANDALEKTRSEVIQQVRVQLQLLAEGEQNDFWSRLVIFDRSPRIGDIPELVKDGHMRSIKREFRDSIFERFEGWWLDRVLTLLAEKRSTPIYGYEVSDKLAALADEYKSDNLPITFRGKMPHGEIDIEGDDRLFVKQLREIGLSSARIRSAILDYYRAYEQRSAWTRENLLVSDELEDYEGRLEDEWGRFRDVVFEDLREDATEPVMREAGRRLYQWAEMETGNISALRIRERVTEPYVVRGSYQILANNAPEPRVHWHPQFLRRLRELLAVTV